MKIIFGFDQRECSFHPRLEAVVPSIFVDPRKHPSDRPSDDAPVRLSAFKDPMDDLVNPFRCEDSRQSYSLFSPALRLAAMSSFNASMDRVLGSIVLWSCTSPESS